MTHDEDLRHLEKARRKALWALAPFSPGDTQALKVLHVLEDVELREAHLISSPESVLTAEQLRSVIPTEPHPIGCRIVREESIPQPWRERFLQASIGSTRVPDGPYAADWYKFLSKWEAEMLHLKEHRAAQAVRLELDLGL